MATADSKQFIVRGWHRGEGRWGIGITLAEAVKNAGLRTAKAGTVEVFIFEGAWWDELGVATDGAVKWRDLTESDRRPIKTVL